MGTVYKPKYTRPLPDGAELFTRKGVRCARWTDGYGRKRTARVTTGRDGSAKIAAESTTFTARYRDGAGHLVQVATGCRTVEAAKTVLAELEARADKVRCGAWTAAEDSVLDHKLTPIGAHIEDYLTRLRNKRGKGGRQRVSSGHVANVEHNLNRVVSECGFKLLRDLNRSALGRWADTREAEGMAARTINAHLVAMTAFGNWCVEANRIVANPFARPPKRDEKAGRKRKRRALTADELRRLLRVARLRPLAEYGRKIVARVQPTEGKSPSSRRTWTRAPLEYDDLEDAIERGREALTNRPDFVTELERRGRERALIYKVLTLTGLRKGELAALTVGHLDLDGTTPYLVLDAADEKAGRGAEIPIRADLAHDIREWLRVRLSKAQEEAKANEAPIPLRAPPELPLVQVPSGLSRIINRDLAAAGIPKIDDRGCTVDVHALRHTFGTHLSKGGVAPRTAQAAMRHGSIDLTMDTYTDPRLLDVAGALDVLPDLPLEEGPPQERQRATGTDDAALAPMLAPNAGNRGKSQAIADKPHSSRTDPHITASGGIDESCARLTACEKKRANGLEPSTFSLEG